MAIKMKKYVSNLEFANELKTTEENLLQINDTLKDIFNKLDKNNIEKYPYTYEEWSKIYKDISDADTRNPEILDNVKKQIKESLDWLKQEEKKLQKLIKTHNNAINTDTQNLVASAKDKLDRIEDLKSRYGETREDYTPSLFNRSKAFVARERQRVAELEKSFVNRIKDFVDNRRNVGVLAYEMKHRKDIEASLFDAEKSVRNRQWLAKGTNDFMRRVTEAKVQWFNVVRAVKNLGRALIGKEEISKQEFAEQMIKKYENDFQKSKAFNEKNLEILRQKNKEIADLHMNNVSNLTSTMFYNGYNLNKDSFATEKEQQRFEMKQMHFERMAMKAICNEEFNNRDSLRRLFKGNRQWFNPKEAMKTFDEYYDSGKYSPDQLKVIRQGITMGLDVTQFDNPALFPENMAIVAAAQMYDVELTNYKSIEDILKSQEGKTPATSMEEINNNPVKQDFDAIAYSEIEKYMENSSIIKDTETLDKEMDNIVEVALENKKIMDVALEQAEKINEQAKENVDVADSKDEKDKDDDFDISDLE